MFPIVQLGADDHMNTSLTYNKTLRLKTMTFQSNLGTSLLPEREPVRVTLALLSSPPSALSPASASGSHLQQVLHQLHQAARIFRSFLPEDPFTGSNPKHLMTVIQRYLRGLALSHAGVASERGSPRRSLGRGTAESGVDDNLETLLIMRECRALMDFYEVSRIRSMTPPRPLFVYHDLLF